MLVIAIQVFHCSIMFSVFDKDNFSLAKLQDKLEKCSDCFKTCTISEIITFAPHAELKVDGFPK